ncbi:MAG: NUDIX domain-containing protein [Candidatus Gottesmanbacteria bacterium]
MFHSNNLVITLKKVISSIPTEKKEKDKFLERTQGGNLSREENPLSHFCVYFAAYDPSAKQVFIGHHIKSGLWLFNGGHFEKGENPKEALKREIKEEWGTNVNFPKIPKPELMTLTKIEHPEKQICRYHYDIWYFFSFNKNQFLPDNNLLAKEFYQIGWKSILNARKLIRDPNTLIALVKVEEML